MTEQCVEGEVAAYCSTLAKGRHLAAPLIGQMWRQGYYHHQGGALLAEAVLSVKAVAQSVEVALLSVDAAALIVGSVLLLEEVLSVEVAVGLESQFLQ